MVRKIKYSRKKNKKGIRRGSKTGKHRRIRKMKRETKGGADTDTMTTIDPYENPNDNRENEMLARGLFPPNS